MGLYRDETGRVIDVDDAFANARGYTPLTSVENADLNARAGIEARGTERGALGSVNAALTGVASGLTLGGSDYLLGKTLPDAEREQLLAEMEAHPYLRGGGEIAGALGGALINPLARTPTGYLSNLAQHEVEAGLAAGGIKGTARALTAMGAEGGAQAVGQYIGHTSLEDKEVTAEGLTGALGTGFAFGSVGGGAVLGVAKGMMAGRKLFARVMGGEKAAEQAASTWSIASQEALEANQATARALETKLENISKAKTAAQRARNEARGAAQEAALEASQARADRAADAKLNIDFETGIPTDVIPRGAVPKPEGGMPTSVFKRPGEPEGPAPLIDVGEQPGGPATSVFTPKKSAMTEVAKDLEKATKAAGKATPTTQAHVGVEVTRDGRKLMRDGQVIEAADAEALARAQMPPGYSLGELNPRVPFKIGSGVPAHADITPNSLYVVKPSELAERGITGNALKEGGVESIAKAGAEGKKLPPIDVNVTPSGKLYIEDGNHRLLAAAKSDSDIAVNFRKVGEDFKPQAGATPLEEQLRGMKAKLDEGVPFREINEGAVPGSPVAPQVPPGKAPPVQPGRKMGSSSINDWLSEKAAFDNGELSMAKKVEDIKGANELRNRRQETLSEIRYKTTEDLLGPTVAKEEQRIADIVDEYNAAKKDFDEIATRGEMSGSADATRAGSPGNRKAIEILDNAHEEALLRAKHAADPQEAGQAITEAEQLENLLERMTTPRLHGPEHPMSAGELRSPHAKAWADELMADAEKVARFEKASAALADEAGDAAHPVSAGHAKAVADADRDATRKMYDRTTRATDDAADGTTASTAKAARKEQIKAQAHLDEMKAQHGEAKTEYNAAAKKVREGEQAKRAALREDVKLGRAATKAGLDAQDAGGILEMIDVPGLPKPSDIPVIGPLLGAYLKFRTLKKALGRAMGKVPATADARVASLASQTRDRIARAVDRSIGAAARSVQSSTKVVPAAAGILSRRIFDDGGHDPKTMDVQDLAVARMRELAAYVHTPNAIERDVRRQLALVTDPDVIAAAEKQHRAGMEFLLSVAPKLPEPNILNKTEFRVGGAQAMSFARSLEAVNDPASVFERLAHEQSMLSLEAAEAMRVVYPRMFSEASARLMERAAQGDLKVPMRQRIQLSLLYKVPLDTSMDPVNIKITQSVYDRKPPMPAPGAPAPAAPSIANPVNISQQMTTAIDRR